MNPTTSRLCGITPPPSHELTVGIFVKGNEKYFWICTPGREAELVQVACRFAANPDLSWTFHDSTELVRSLKKCLDAECEGT